MSDIDTPQSLAAWVERVPYARFLGVAIDLAGDEMTARLPYAERLIGNPTLPALHGGVLGAFMEITAIAQLWVLQGPGARQPRPVGVTVQYLRSGRPKDTYARAQVKRMGRRIANIYVEAWQDERAAPIASLYGHFLVAPKEATGAG